jgi:hypothetical protein
MQKEQAMDDKTRERRVREKARHLWQEDGSPEGREADYLDRASELVAIEESQKDTLKPNPLHEYETRPTREPIEPIEAVRNQGEFPTLTDEGEEATYPDRKNYAGADEPPVSEDRRK